MATKQLRVSGDRMLAAYLAVNIVASAVNGIAAVLNLVGHEYPKTQADKLGVPRWWTWPLGMLLGAGALGLLAGLVVPVLGVVAAAGLVLYFLGAFGAHLRARDTQLGPWAFFFTLAVAALVVNLSYRAPWS
jgi:hypothetical protein